MVAVVSVAVNVARAAPAIGVLAVQGDVREHARALEGAGAVVTTVRRPAELEAVDGLVIPGGESTTMDKLVRAFELYAPLRQRIADGLPVYGSCAGMIMLADRITDAPGDQQTLGGLDITVRRNAFGRQVDSFEEDVAFAGLDAPMHAIFIRAPWVERAGPSVQVLARVRAGRETSNSGVGGARAGIGPPTGRIVAVRQGALLATSFHPEVTGDTRVHELFVEIVREHA